MENRRLFLVGILLSVVFSVGAFMRTFDNVPQTTNACEDPYGNAVVILTVDLRLEPVMNREPIASVPTGTRLWVRQILGDFMYVEYVDLNSIVMRGWVLNYDIQLDD